MLTVHRIGSKEALRDARAARSDWLRELRAGAQAQTRRRFRSPPRNVLLARLERAADELDFRIESVSLHRPVQLAPEIVLETTHYLGLAHALPHVVDRIDPPPRSNRRAYEGIFIEAVDERGIPFVIVSDALCGQVVGSQWARSEPLFPYPHG